MSPPDRSVAVDQESPTARWAVLVWLPVLSWAGFGLITLVRLIVEESRGGPNLAPLAGFATGIAVGLAVLLGIIIGCCLIWRPRRFPPGPMSIAILLTVAIPYALQTAQRKATAQQVILHILDSAGKPLPGAVVHYTRYRYGPRGMNVYDGKGGPLVSDEKGIVTIPSRAMRYQTDGVINKPGYRGVFFTLGMQYSEWDTTREAVLGTEQTERLARINVPAANPVSFPIYLPPASDAPVPLRRTKTTSDIGRNPDSARFLDLETGRFGPGPEGDVRFDLFFERESEYERPRLRITGVNGAKVSQVPPSFSVSEGVPSYECLFRLAPKAGYQESTVIQRPGDSPEPMIYVKARDGSLYGRLTANVWGKSTEPKANCRVDLFVNPMGSRLLE